MHQETLDVSVAFLVLLDGTLVNNTSDIENSRLFHQQFQEFTGLGSPTVDRRIRNDVEVACSDNNDGFDSFD